MLAMHLLLAQLPMLLVVHVVELPPHLHLAAFASANILLSNTALRLLLLHRDPRCMMTSSTSMIVDTRWGIGSPPSLAVVGLVVAVVGLVEPLDWWRLLDWLVAVGEPLDAWASSHPVALSTAFGGNVHSRSAKVCSD
jgi:hypothetical protein